MKHFGIMWLLKNGAKKIAALTQELDETNQKLADSEKKYESQSKLTDTLSKYNAELLDRIEEKDYEYLQNIESDFGFNPMNIDMNKYNLLSIAIKKCFASEDYIEIPNGTLLWSRRQPDHVLAMLFPGATDDSVRLQIKHTTRTTVTPLSEDSSYIRLQPGTVYNHVCMSDIYDFKASNTYNYILVYDGAHMYVIRQNKFYAAKDARKRDQLISFLRINGISIEGLSKNRTMDEPFGVQTDVLLSDVVDMMNSKLLDDLHRTLECGAYKIQLSKSPMAMRYEALTTEIDRAKINISTLCDSR